MNTINKFFRWYFSRNALPYWAVLAFDTFVVLFSGLVCYALDHGPSSTTKVFWPLLGTLCFYLLFFIIGFRVTRIYSGVLRYSSFADLYRIGVANLIGIVSVVVLRWFFHADAVFVPIRTKELVFMGILATAIMASARVMVKFLYEHVLDNAALKPAFI